MFKVTETSLDIGGVIGRVNRCALDQE